MSDFWSSALSSLYEKLCADFQCDMRAGAEIECYVDGLETLPDADGFWQGVSDACADADIALESIAKETDGQFEFRLKPTAPTEAATHVARLKEVVQEVAKQAGIEIAFEALRDGMAANGLHWHVHLTNDAGDYVFFKQEENMTPPLHQSLAGLCATMRESMLCFAQSDEAYLRLRGAQDHVPQTVSWGGNNRSVALRMPESVVPHRHIEHRVCAADTHPHASLWAIVMGMHYGLTHQPELSEQMYGNASDMQYDLPRLTTHKDDAINAWKQSEILKEYIDVEDALHALKMN